MAWREVNFDGLVGPTHNYAGLSYGNVASQTHAGATASPRQAALEGLAKMRALVDLGLPQGVLPPQERPDVDALRRLGFDGSEQAVLEQAAREAPALLAACASASSMWAANAATVVPSADSADGRVHVVPANLRATFHRALEPETTGRALARVLPAESEPFVHHAPLPGAASLDDEGAANHTRLAPDEGAPGVHLFVYGRTGLAPDADGPARYPARQTREASEAVARLHRLPPERRLFARQRPEAIDHGVFHNDVIAVGHAHVLLFHEDAFADTWDVVDRLRRALDGALTPIPVHRDELTLDEAVQSYLFNSQLVRVPQGQFTLVAPSECEQQRAARRVVERIVGDADNPIADVRYLDVRQSMRNGGGPACLRLRVPLTDAEIAHVHTPCLLDEARHETLAAWVRRHYRDELRPEDLADPALLDESRAALDELTRILDLGTDFYPFQR